MVAVCKNARVLGPWCTSKKSTQSKLMQSLSTMVSLLAAALIWGAKPRESVSKSNFWRWKMLEDKTSTYERTALREWATQWRTHKSIDSLRIHVHWGECIQMCGPHTNWALGQLKTCLRKNLRVWNAYNHCRSAWCAFACSSCICLRLPRCTRSCDSILWMFYTAWFTFVAFLIHTGRTPSCLLSRHLISASQNITTKMMLWGSSSPGATKSCLDVSKESCSLACSGFVSFAEDCMCKQLCCSHEAHDCYLQEVSWSFASCH